MSATQQAAQGSLRDAVSARLPKNPSLDQVRAVTLQIIRSKDGKQFFEEFAISWALSNYKSLTTPSEAVVFLARTHSARMERSQRIRQEAAADRVRIVEFVILNTLLPNGKTLRDCTVAEAEKHAPQLNGHMLRVIERARLKAKPRDRIGAVVTDAEAAKL